MFSRMWLLFISSAEPHATSFSLLERKPLLPTALLSLSHLFLRAEILPWARVFVFFSHSSSSLCSVEKTFSCVSTYTHFYVDRPPHFSYCGRLFRSLCKGWSPSCPYACSGDRCVDPKQEAWSIELYMHSYTYSVPTPLYTYVHMYIPRHACISMTHYRILVYVCYSFRRVARAVSPRCLSDPAMTSSSCKLASLKREEDISSFSKAKGKHALLFHRDTSRHGPSKQMLDVLENFQEVSAKTLILYRRDKVYASLLHRVLF